RLREGVGEQAEVAAAAAREVAAEEPHRRNRDFDQPVRALGAEGRPRRIRHAIEVALHRIDAGTVEVAFLLEGRPGPGRVVANAESRGAVAVNPDAGGVLENSPRAPDVLPESLRG